MQINHREQHQSQCEQKSSSASKKNPVYGCDYHPRMENEGYVAPPTESFGGIPSQKKIGLLDAIGVFHGESQARSELVEVVYYNVLV